MELGGGLGRLGMGEVGGRVEAGGLEVSVGVK